MRVGRGAGALVSVLVASAMGCSSGGSKGPLPFPTSDASTDKDATVVVDAGHEAEAGPSLGNDASGFGVCTPATCKSLGVTCGVQGDGCGGMIQCGTCTPPATCGGGGPSTCGGDSGCVPAKCGDLSCGPIGDGCGGVVQCGGCSAGEICGVTGSPSMCAFPLVLDGSAGDAGNPCIPLTCAKLGITCGPAGDGCGSGLDCGSCEAPQTCGGGGKPGACGGDNGCKPKTCGELGAGCGMQGDGCGGVVNCGTCMAPNTCGAGSIHNVCVSPDGGSGDAGLPPGCVSGTCTMLPSCGAGTTTLTGKVYDPALRNGLYNATVYVPNDTSDPLLQPFPAGISCDICGADTFAGSPLVMTSTGTDGTFTLTGVPVGPAIPLVIQIGRWRRQLTVPITNACATNAAADKTLSMPTNHTQGDLPRVAVVTGSADAVECLFRKIGVEDSEFGDPGSAAYIQLYVGNGASYDGNTPPQASLFAPTGGPSNGPLINNYDVTILDCEGAPYMQPTDQQAALAAYAGAGGRVFGSHYQYTWMYENPLFMGAASWEGNGSAPTSSVEVIDPAPGNPIGSQFQAWLEGVGASVPGSGTVNISPAIGNTSGVIAPTQEWLHSQGTTTPIHFTFNTPIGATPQTQCGRVTYSDWHAGLGGGAGTFPMECSGSGFTPQDAILEFMLFDLTSCVTSVALVCKPSTCASQGVTCGPTGDGCGNVLQCGTCGAPQSCGGGGVPGTCGGNDGCVPETCASQGFNCGPAGDGCGGAIRCGTCPAGQFCGGSGMPNVCSMIPECAKQTCEALGAKCGPAGDGCGGELQCGTCPSGETCGGGGVPFTCGVSSCVPITCADQHIACGPAGDGCGGALQCGTCPSPETCGGGGTPSQCGTMNGPR